MRYLELNNNDKNYPFVIRDAWGGRVYLHEDAVKRLGNEINAMFDNLDESNMTTDIINDTISVNKSNPNVCTDDICDGSGSGTGGEE